MYIIILAIVRQYPQRSSRLRPTSPCRQGDAWPGHQDWHTEWEPVRGRHATDPEKTRVTAHHRCKQGRHWLFNCGPVVQNSSHAQSLCNLTHTHTHTHTRTHTHTHTHTLGTTGTFLLTIWHANITFHKQIQNLSTPSHKERVHTWLLYNFHTKNMQLVWDWFLSMSHCILCHKNMSKDKMGIDKAYIWCTLDFSGFVTPSPTYQINVRQYCLIYVKGHNKRSLAALLETQVTLSLQE